MVPKGASELQLQLSSILNLTFILKEKLKSNQKIRLNNNNHVGRTFSIIIESSNQRGKTAFKHNLQNVHSYYQSLLLLTVKLALSLSQGQ